MIRDHPLYTGTKQGRVTHKSPAGTVVNSAYYGEGNVIQEWEEQDGDTFPFDFVTGKVLPQVWLQVS